MNNNLTTNYKELIVQNIYNAKNKMQKENPMQYLSELFILALTIQIALMSPGPDFMVTIRQTVNYGKKYAYYSSMGIGIGIFIHVGYTLLGMGIILKNFPYFLDTVKVLGALYLIYLGITSLKSKVSEVKLSQEIQNSYSLKKSFFMGFLSNLLNPKATLFFLSIFTAIVSVDTPLYIQSLYGLYCILMNILWYMFVANILAKPKNLDWFNKHQYVIGKAIGIIFLFLGLQLVLS